ncbi:hypothetical protein C5B42_02920 [Candidatus Cerribacteria bacterium 'Amazon FNV 2010 28 9']|uniref:Uncharacterized protein n=1 Tax=Candidatus Cerribacteria bacterium 'Amazon FNV 2010 28 9' TaxID=2081795 RepID=A0A317JNW4_9BACT|nr:MAG: hypothetical protein C5B42_02920 [Candidatus Cerribacteria bacterium 'Amazon FNV 2010 28 9']
MLTETKTYQMLLSGCTAHDQSIILSQIRRFAKSSHLEEKITSNGEKKVWLIYTIVPAVASAFFSLLKDAKVTYNIAQPVEETQEEQLPQL